jgi:glycosidase
LHSFYKALLELRKMNTAIREGGDEYILQTGADDKVFSYLIVKDEARVLIVLNLSATDKLQLTIKDDKLAGNYVSLVSGVSHTIRNEEKFELQAWEYFIYASS